MGQKRSFVGKLIGHPFMASVDRTGSRADKNNCAYVVGGYVVPSGYKAYLLDNTYPAEYAQNLSTHCPEASILYGVPSLEDVGNYDVLEVDDRGVGFLSYRDTSADNVLFITNKCNSNCIMCPDAGCVRKQEDGNNLPKLSQLIELIPSDAPHLTITGGEPTLLKWDFIKILTQCKNKLKNTEFLMLSNGRSFCVDKYRNAFLASIPEVFRLAVPIYAADSEKHDAITRAPGSFVQTVYALKHLQGKVRLEVRVVIMKNNYQDLAEIAQFLAKELPRTDAVSFMGMELLGNAAINRDKLWIDYEETVEQLEKATHILLRAGIDVRIYNYPLCGLPRQLWHLAVKSITDYKVRYKDACNGCSVKEACGGFFFSTINYDRISVSPITEG